MRTVKVDLGADQNQGSMSIKFGSQEILYLHGYEYEVSDDTADRIEAAAREYRERHEPAR